MTVPQPRRAARRPAGLKDWWHHQRHSVGVSCDGLYEAGVRRNQRVAPLLDPEEFATITTLWGRSAATMDGICRRCRRQRSRINAVAEGRDGGRVRTAARLVPAIKTVSICAYRDHSDAKSPATAPSIPAAVIVQLPRLRRRWTLGETDYRTGAGRVLHSPDWPRSASITPMTHISAKIQNRVA